VFMETYDDEYVADLEDDISGPYQGWNEPETQPSDEEED